MSQGAFLHLQPDFAGIPMWLPALYASGGFAFAAVGNLLACRLEGAETARVSRQPDSSFEKIAT